LGLSSRSRADKELGITDTVGREHPCHGVPCRVCIVAFPADDPSITKRGYRRTGLTSACGLIHQLRWALGVTGAVESTLGDTSQTSVLVPGLIDDDKTPVGGSGDLGCLLVESHNRIDLEFIAYWRTRGVEDAGPNSPSR